jgi:hypothetical protein
MVGDGCFAISPGLALPPSMQPGFRDDPRGRSSSGMRAGDETSTFLAECAWCHQRVDMGDGIYDDGH